MGALSRVRSQSVTLVGKEHSLHSWAPSTARSFIGPLGHQVPPFKASTDWLQNLAGPDQRSSAQRHLGPSPLASGHWHRLLVLTAFFFDALGRAARRR